MTQQGPVANAIEQKLRLSFAPTRLEIENESHRHSSGLGSESHFKVLMVSERFEGLSRIQRQRDVFAALAEEMKVVHALTLRLMTPAEDSEGASQGFKSPPCHSKTKI